MLEGCFEHCRRDACLHDLACFFQRLWRMPVIVRDEMPAGKALAGSLTDLVPGIENRLKGVAGHRREAGCVAVVPNPQMALCPGEVP